MVVEKQDPVKARISRSMLVEVGNGLATRRENPVSERFEGRSPHCKAKKFDKVCRLDRKST